MTRRIVVANQKGGTGKSSVVVNLGACLGLRGKHVLIIDLDSQRHATFWLGIKDSEVEKSIYDVLTDKNTLVSTIIQKTGVDNLDLAPASPDVAHAELMLAGMKRREYALLDKVRDTETRYDFIFIDCPPSLGLLSVNAMAYAHEVFIPLDASDFLSLEGLSRLLATIQRIQENINDTLKVTGIVLNKFDPRLKLCREIQETVKEHPEIGGQLFKTVIRRNITIAESVSFGLPVMLYDEGAHGAEDYQKLADEVIKQ